MENASRRLLLPLALLALLFAGCGQETEQALTDDEFAADLADLAPATKSVRALPLASDHAVSLDLRVGQRFPFHRTVEQTLTQAESVSRSQIDLWLTISVEDVTREGRARLAVLFDRVAYQRAVENDVLQYDSRQPPVQLPLELLPWHGLRGNRFSFWLGPEGDLQELVGFDGFLERTLSSLPHGNRQALAAHWSGEFGKRGLAELVDESIGLLAPPEKTTDEKGETKSVKLKTGWKFTRRQQLREPLAAMITTTYRLQSLEGDTVRIELQGDIRPTAPVQVAQVEASHPTVAVRKGHTAGHCTIDLISGLPIESNIERYLEMVVHVGEGADIEQRKRTVVTVRRLDPDEAGKAGMTIVEPIDSSPPPPRRISEGSEAASRERP